MELQSVTSQPIKIFYTYVSSLTITDLERRDHSEVPTINIAFVYWTLAEAVIVIWLD